MVNDTAQILNSAWVAPACGTITNDVVRKHFEIPACNTCLLTEKTAALEAAGFVDQVNCVFADDTDVLDKLEWLFENPDELDRITKAGKQLIESRHKIQHRDQVFQWYTLHKKLKPGQKIVQPGPFLPLTVAEENSGVVNGHIKTVAIDRQLLKLADEEMRSGKYDVAENLYRRCLNYVSMEYAEPRFRLILCLLHKGNYKAALASVRELFPTYRLKGKHGFEPDPTEWAWYIIVLLCCGKNREAAIRAEQFATVHNEELQRVRRVVRLLCGQNNEPASETSPTNPRASVHQPPELAIDEWLEKIGHMLRACGQSKTVSMLEGARLTFQILDADKFSPKQSNDTRPLARGSRKNLTKRGRFGDTVLQYYLAIAARFSRFVQRNTTRAQRQMNRISRYLPNSSPRIADSDWAAIIRLLQKEEIKCGVLIGATNGSWLSNAFMRGLKVNPNGPSVACVNYDTPKFRRFHRRMPMSQM